MLSPSSPTSTQKHGGGKLEKMADSLKMEDRPLNGKMTKHGKFTQVLTGCLQYFKRVSAGELNVITHRVSCVQACAPPEAVTVGKAAMIMAYESRFRGITYSASDPETSTFASGGASPDVSFATGFPGFPRDAGIHVVGDCTWGDRNVYGMLFMMNHGAIATDTKKMGPVDSSAEGEGITTSKCAELTVFIREVARGMGILDDKPTVIRSDNASSVRVANDPKAAGRLRHAMRRYSVLQEHVKQGVVRVEFIRDANNAADFLTSSGCPQPILRESAIFSSLPPPSFALNSARALAGMLLHRARGDDAVADVLGCVDLDLPRLGLHELHRLHEGDEYGVARRGLLVLHAHQADPHRL